MAQQTEPNDTSEEFVKQLIPRGWAFSLFWAAAIVGVSIIASATINPLFDRSVHWDWMAVLAPAGFIALTLAFRKRWV